MLFQTGETAYGKPIVNGQHPHDFVMELSLQYAHKLGEHALWDVYYAPVGDPALGPVAYPHRASASEIPQATLGHHWEDSTHILYNVVTAGLSYKAFRLRGIRLSRRRTGRESLEPSIRRDELLLRAA